MGNYFTKTKLIIMVTISAGILWVYYLPNVYKQQFMYAVFTSPYQGHKIYLEQLITSRIIDFTDKKDVVFYCYGTKELSNAVTTKQFAQKHNLKLVNYKDILANFNAGIQRFYLVKSDGSVELFAYIDDRVDFNPKAISSIKDYHVLTPRKRCFFNTRPIKVYFNDG
jgi:hypothetical protein